MNNSITRLTDILYSRVVKLSPTIPATNKTSLLILWKIVWFLNITSKKIISTNPNTL